MKTRRRVLIEAGVPAEELARVDNPRLDEASTLDRADDVLVDAFSWRKSPQGVSYWHNLCMRLAKERPQIIAPSGHAKPATIPCAPAIRAWLCIADDGNVAAAITLDAADVYRRSGRTIVPLYAEPEHDHEACPGMTCCAMDPDDIEDAVPGVDDLETDR